MSLQANRRSKFTVLFTVIDFLIRNLRAADQSRRKRILVKEIEWYWGLWRTMRWPPWQRRIPRSFLNLMISTNPRPLDDNECWLEITMSVCPTIPCHDHHKSFTPRKARLYKIHHSTYEPSLLFFVFEYCRRTVQAHRENKLNSWRSTTQISHKKSVYNGNHFCL